MPSDNTLSDIERKLLEIIPATHWADAYLLEKKLEQSGFVVADVVNALGALVGRGLLQHKVHHSHRHDVALFRRSQ